MEIPNIGYVGVTLLAVVSAALVGARLYARRRHQPGSAAESDPATPVARALRHHHVADDDDTAADAVEESLVPGLDAPTDVAVGVADGHELLWDLARSTGLGLTGPGAPAATRAMLINLLGAGGPTYTLDQFEVVTNHDTAVALLGTEPPADLPRLTITATTDGAVSYAEAEQLGRARILDMLDFPDATAVRTHQPQETLTPVLLLTSPDHTHAGRLHALLEAGRTLNITGLFLDNWPTGHTIHVNTDGTITATTDPHGHDIPNLADAKLFQLTEPATAELLELLRRANPEANVDQPQPSPEPDEAESGQPAATIDPPPPTQANGTSPAIRIVILGGLHAYPNTGDHDLIANLAPKPRLLLGYLTLHPNGATLDAPHRSHLANHPTTPSRPTLPHRRH